MRYKKFIIKQYRAITQETIINIEKESLIPIIGVNECGKTTILHGILAFDYYNDNSNQGRHIKDTQNLYKINSPDSMVCAEIEFGKSEFSHRALEILKDLDLLTQQTVTGKITELEEKLATEFSSTLIINRNLNTKTYSIDKYSFGRADIDDKICKEVLKGLPYVLYFDDFMDSVEEKIEIKKANIGTGWLGILDRLFKKADPSFDILLLKDKDPRERKSILAKVKSTLNQTLTKEWENFKLDDRAALQISLDFVEEEGKGFIRLDVIETSRQGEHYFFIRDRSKGFYWFFNFVMKLEFNPKRLSTAGQEAIYLLDEPGSYLHALAQTKLCKKLHDLASQNKVIYCTHSPYLLNPEIIPLNNVKVSDRDAIGSVRLLSIYDYKGSILDRRSAFQPILDALQLKPFFFDLSQDKIVIIVEGIYDYYSLDMFKEMRNINILPSVGGESIKYYISVMIGWKINYRALWDNDDSGRKAKNDAEKHFGQKESSDKFYLLPIAGNSKNRILQNLFEADDIVMIKNKLFLPTDVSFEKTILSLYYSGKRSEIIGRISAATRKNFTDLFDSLKLQ